MFAPRMPFKPTKFQAIQFCATAISTESTSVKRILIKVLYVLKDF